MGSLQVLQYPSSLMPPPSCHSAVALIFFLQEPEPELGNTAVVLLSSFLFKASSGRAGGKPQPTQGPSHFFIIACFIPIQCFCPKPLWCKSFMWKTLAGHFLQKLQSLSKKGKSPSPFPPLESSMARIRRSI